MRFDAEELKYGFVLTRMPKDSEWWHGHLVRGDVLYYCELLGRRTNLLFTVQKFGIGVTPRSRQFLLTLDGEGIPDEHGVHVKYDWDDAVWPGDKMAEWVCSTVLPRVFGSDVFQRTLWFLIKHLEYETVADVESMSRLGDGVGG